MKKLLLSLLLLSCIVSACKKDKTVDKTPPPPAVVYPYSDTLKGSFHLHNYGGFYPAIDTTYPGNSLLTYFAEDSVLLDMGAVATWQGKIDSLGNYSSYRYISRGDITERVTVNAANVIYFYEKHTVEGSISDDYDVHQIIEFNGR